MKKIRRFFKKYVYTDHKIVAKDDELVTVLKVLDEYGVHDFMIVTCGWIGQTDWCLQFKISDAMWDYVVEDLKKEGLKNITLFGKDRNLD